MNTERLITLLQTEKGKETYKKINSIKEFSINDIQKLEKEYLSAPVKDILSLINLQRKNERKIDKIEELVLNEKGVQQASSTILAQYHAQKFKNFSVIADLCCGIGIDLIHLSENKVKTFAVDNNLETLNIARFNCDAFDRINIKFIAEKAENFLFSVDAIFADPDRRPSNRRKIAPEDLSPNLTSLLSLQKITENMAIKLSPSMNYKNMDLPEYCTLEFVSESGTLKEILLCTGKLASPNCKRKAVLLPETITICDKQNKIKIEEINNFVFEPDKAIIRAGLVQECGNEIGYQLIDAKLALLTSKERTTSQFGNCYEVISYFDFNVKKLKEHCSNLKVGNLVIKTRGFPDKVEDFRKKLNLKLKGRKKMILFIIRRTKNHQMILAEEESSPYLCVNS